MIRKDVWVKALTLILLLFIVVLPETSSGAERKPIIVVFRYDDCSSKSPTDLEIKLINAFQQYEVPATFGVIPYVSAGNQFDLTVQDVMPLTAGKAEILRNAISSGILEVAQHGYSHQAVGVRSERVNAEFIGLDYDEQFRRIADGKSILQEMLGIQVTTFIPPWDSCDINTIRVLENLAFKSLSANGLGVVAGASNESSRLKFLPATCKFLDLQNAVKSARKSSELQPVIVACLHPEEFREDYKRDCRLTYQDVVQTLAWVTSQEDVRLLTIGQAAATMDDLDLPRFMSFSRFFRTLHPLCPSFLQTVYFFPSLRTLTEVKVKSWLSLVLFYLAALTISMVTAYVGGSVIFSKFMVIRSVAKFAALVLLVAFSLYAFHDLDVYWDGAIILTCLFGGCIGIWGSIYKIKRQSCLT
jgi:peptidoglycan/xylan/chitin deacetylase (PgdA/CDA1 family)